MSIVTNDDAAAFAELAAVFCTLPLPVAIVDLETTGGHFAQDRITEIANINGWLIRSSQSAILLLS